ncbi:flagellar biosynthesis protein FlhF [Pectinatus frisingensis]|uniref:flagellar biosynthesis protein FlhF n=1 Tax=Pectinatus frisingensis TaxID=865 RepID=UPI0018C68731|nr:flagellar biosynthesis protein FlhF [Pectinatus frisingensis]
MQIKVFKERTAKAAMDRVRAELGADAVILHTKKYTTGGIFGYGGKKMVEVTAAVEDKPRTAILPPVIDSTAPAPDSKPISKPVRQQAVPEQMKPIVPKKVLQNYKTVNYNEPAADTPGEDTVSADHVRQPKIIKASDNMQDMNTGENGQEVKIRQLETELAQMKLMLNDVLKGQGKSAESDTVSLQEALQQQEVDDAIIEEIVNQSADSNALLDKNMPAARKILLDYLAQYIKPPTGIELTAGRPKIVALIGTTGVGKTTTLAKIAARFALEHGVRAALITADTYRISAVDQLKTYSDIIGLPLEIVYSPSELKDTIDKHKDKQLILIDTAGRSQHNEYQLMELHDLLAASSGIEKHLVLSATTKPRDVVDIIRKFSLCAPDRVIFTKTDETSSIGMVLNLLKQYPITLSYFTNGQSVPDDIFPALAKNLADLLLR